ncbi:hypothetical protein [Actinophytocola sp.]|uniref:hypothetical protein n=1 Tax=Actinophytocola sp. TaxID=1872138 RepID=UPI002D7F7893|nr:hypothetical protein [Actinophytocola sp.]HET9142211.1 hypothetical protein [Actinophytocola sp.]
MGKATKTVKFTWNAAGRVAVAVSPDLRPLDDFLETEIGESLSTLALITGRVRAGEPWAFGGDCCHLTVRAGEVCLENDFTGCRVTLAGAEFLDIAGEFERAVRAGRG